MNDGWIALGALVVALGFYKVVNTESKPYVNEEEDDDDYRRGGTRRKRGNRKSKRR